MSDNNKEKEEEKPIVAKTAVDLQRLKLMKLMKNPEKPVILPERPKAKNTPTVPEFVRNVMGSSAGAGSGEFHVYRHLRRKEYARQKFIQEKGRKELLDEEYHHKLEENKRLAEEATAKKRAKRLKKKQKWKQKKRTKTTSTEKSNVNEVRSSDEESSDNDETNVENKDELKDEIIRKDQSEKEIGEGDENSSQNEPKDNVQDDTNTETSPISSTAEDKSYNEAQNEPQLQSNVGVVVEDSKTTSKDEVPNDTSINTQHAGGEAESTGSNTEEAQKEQVQCSNEQESKENKANSES